MACSGRAYLNCVSFRACSFSKSSWSTKWSTVVHNSVLQTTDQYVSITLSKLSSWPLWIGTAQWFSLYSCWLAHMIAQEIMGWQSMGLNIFFLNLHSFTQQFGGPPAGILGTPQGIAEPLLKTQAPKSCLISYGDSLITCCCFFLCSFYPKSQFKHASSQVLFRDIFKYNIKA